MEKREINIENKKIVKPVKKRKRKSVGKKNQVPIAKREYKSGQEWLRDLIETDLPYGPVEPEHFNSMNEII